MAIKIGIIGANGYIGLEIIRLLNFHPNAEIKYIYKHQNEIIDEFNHLKEFNLKTKQTNDINKFKECDCVFLSLPENKSIEYINALIGKTKIINLGSDYRLNNKNLHNDYYSSSYNEKIQSQFVYGFIEKNASAIKTSQNISNPGCFALCAQLTILPIHDKIQKIDIFGITGSSGGGKIPTLKNHHSIRSKDFFSYNINKHRHLGEIFQSFPKLNSNNISFVPASGPFVRGIFLNCFVEIKKEYNFNQISSIFNKFIDDSKFIRHQKDIKISNVIGSNYFDISFVELSPNKLLIQSCLDNLIKGAAGNAIQCMNIIFKLDEEEGLNNLLPIYV